MQCERKEKYKFTDGKALSSSEISSLMDGIESGELEITESGEILERDALPLKGEYPVEMEQRKGEFATLTGRVTHKIMGVMGQVGRAGEEIVYGIKRQGFFRWRAKSKLTKDAKAKVGDEISRSMDCILPKLQRLGYRPEDITSGRVGITELLEKMGECQTEEYESKGKKVGDALPQGTFEQFREAIQEKLQTDVMTYLDENMGCILDTLEEAGYSRKAIAEGNVPTVDVINVVDACLGKKLGMAEEVFQEIPKGQEKTGEEEEEEEE